MTLLVLLTRLAKPEQQIAVFHIVTAAGDPVAGLNRPDALTIPPSREGLSVTKFVDGHAVVLIFPEQVPEVDLAVRPVSFGPTYRGTIGFAGNRQRTLVLGRDLKQVGVAAQ